MRRIPLLMAVAALLSLAFIGACNKDVPQSELDKFITEIENMPHEAALDTLRQLTDAPAPTNAYARYELGNMFYAMGSDSARTRGWNDEFARAYLDSAQGWFELAVEADTSFVEAYVNLGALWDDRADMMATRREREERITTAQAMYEKALAIKPHDEKARCNLGSLYKRQNRFEDAMNEYTAVLEHNPESALAHYNLAILFATQKIYGEAIHEFELAAKYDPKGDIGERSQENIKVVRDLMESAVPTSSGAAH